MSNDLAALLLALATENAELRQQLATAQDLLMETAIDAGHLHARIEAVQRERDAWCEEAEQLSTRLYAPGRGGRAIG
jgi:Tfp pilus assembly protein PilN